MVLRPESKRTTVARGKRWTIGAALALLSVLTLAICGWAVVNVQSQPGQASAHHLVTHAYTGAYATAASVPVLVYHEMNNGCKPTAILCPGKDPETVSTRQFASEMKYLAGAGYHTVTMEQYVAWLRNGQTRLPVNPILIMADNGIFAFLNGAQEILARYGFTGVAAIVTGFADAAAGKCDAPKVDGINVQPGCPGSSEYWDATWSQLQGFDPSIWSYVLEAGPSGHYVQDYNPACPEFDTCLLPGETIAGYKARISHELSGGEAELQAELSGEVDPAAWVVPYSDMGYPHCAQADCTPQTSSSGAIPAGFLTGMAARQFAAVFVEDADRNGIHNERFRFDVNGQDTLSYFSKTLAAFTAAGDFNRD